MTAEQVLGIAQTATDMLQAPAAPAPAAPAAPSFDIADDEYMTGAQYKRAMAERRPDMTAINLAADSNLAYVRRDNAVEFSKYGRELDALIARVPVEQRTIDNLQTCVKMIRGEHLDEIVSERAQQLAATIAPTLRPTGGGAAPAPASREASLESEKIPDEWKERARTAKITENAVADFCRANGMTPAQFYKQFDTPLNKIVEDVSIRKQA